MPKSHRPYAPEFRRQMVDLVRSGRTPEALSREFEPTAQAIPRSALVPAVLNRRPSHGGPRVRIHLPPAGRLLRT